MGLISARYEGRVDTATIRTDTTRRYQSGLKRLGAFIRRRAQTSIRYRKKKSAPGSPPSTHRSESFKRAKKTKTGATEYRPTSPLRELIVFAITEDGRSVIVGPMIFRRSALGGGQVPRRLEEGGSGDFVSNGKRKVGRWLPRPYMTPAFRAELPRAPKLFAA